MSSNHAARLIQGDCLDVMQSMETDAVEVCVTSPPYNIDVSYGTYSDRRDDYIDWTLVWLTEAVRVSRRGVMLNIDNKASGQSDLFRLLGVIADLFTIQNTIIWVKSLAIDGLVRGHVKPINSERYLNHGHELILHVVEKPTAVDRLAVGVPYADKSNLKRFGTPGRPDLRCAGTVWFEPYSTRNQKFAHPAAFPVALAKRMISYAGGDGVVLDPFVGSGSTLVAANDLCRPSIGIELDPQYIEMTRERLAA